MAGPNLELFKFGMYLFFPLAVMVHFGAPDWYHNNVVPIRDQFWPKADLLYKPPRDSEGVRNALEEMKAKRLAKREARLLEEGREAMNAPSTSLRQDTSGEGEARGTVGSGSRVADLVREKQSQRLV